jgi:hypothetical protein
LQSREPASCVHFYSRLLQSVAKGEIDSELAFFSDEAWFHLPGYISTQNNRYWSSQNPHLTHDVPAPSSEVGVLCAVSERRVVGPMFLNETINCEGYVQVILRQSFPELIGETLYGWFQQDSATAHTSRISMQALADVFRQQNNQQWYLTTKFT